MARRKNKKSKKEYIGKYKFYLTNAFGPGKEHYGLEISSNDKEWTFLVLTHTPSGHYRLKYDPITGKKNPEISFLNTSLRTKHIGTRLRLDTTRKLSKEDEEYIDSLIKKLKKPIRANRGTLHISNRQIQPF